ncbi:hypothetical protein R9C00_20460 [Flammeovirgaceae bacterium SG7u.111]|nr:hypothetical protein [Flammeovirgaceae bacterium SG7u.132]WPO34076.1 hypothetical protein R9C00_20460 [Flammeovirgaceae bacterium SG7u.111]
MIFDFHAHPSFKPFNSRCIHHLSDQPLPDPELWKERFRPKGSTHILPRMLEKEVNYTSQIHLNSMAQGRIKGMCVSIYPLERVFTIALEGYKNSPLEKILNIIPGNEIVEEELKEGFFKMVATLTGYDADVIDRVNRGEKSKGTEYHYFNQAKLERDYLISHQNKLPDYGLTAYEIANNYEEYKKIIDDDKIAFLLSAEGMNMFLDESTNFEKHLAAEKAGDTAELRKIYTENVTEFKTYAYPPFVLTFAHHQYNFLSGHAPSFVGIADTFFDQSGSAKGLDGKEVSYFDLGFTPLGFDILELLLNRKVGRRVLIDTKHLSAKARLEYHKYVKEQREQGDFIPIVQTHTAVSGRASMADGIGENPKKLAKTDKKSEFFTISINLFDDEIVDIVESDGLMGIMLDEKRTMGKRLPKQTLTLAQELEARPVAPKFQELQNDPQKKFEYNKGEFKQSLSKLVKLKCELALEKKEESPSQRKIRRLKNKIDRFEGKVNYLRMRLEHCFLSLFMNQVLYIVKTVENSDKEGLKGGKAWDHICIGSDYEGVINPLDVFYYAHDLQGLENKLEIFWYKAIRLSEKYPEFQMYKDYLFGKKPSYYIKKMLWDNSEMFLKKYFTEEYLKNGNGGIESTKPSLVS